MIYYTHKRKTAADKMLKNETVKDGNTKFKIRFNIKETKLCQ
jgi:hypothetical protein